MSNGITSQFRIQYLFAASIMELQCVFIPKIEALLGSFEKMKNKELWHASKFVKTTKNRWRASMDTKEVNVSSRLIANFIAQWYEKSIPQYAKGSLLDLGCGKVPLYGIYQPYTTNVCCVDWENSLHSNLYLDYTCNLNEPLNLPNNSFDTIILSDVLEHIVEPKILFTEVYRILRPGGKVLLNVPFYYPIHEAPFDYHRYTEFALQKLSQEVSLEILELNAIGGASIILIDVLSKKIVQTPIIGKFLAKFLQKIGFICYRKKQNDSTNFPFIYFLVAQKV